MAVPRIAGAGIGLVFGFMICWSGMVSPNVIQGALRFEETYLFFFMGAAMGTATIGLAILRRRGGNALLTGAPIAWKPEAIERRHIQGAFMFGVGWGVTNVCPGPVAAQVGQGIGWALITITGVFIGVWAYQRQAACLETEPAVDTSAVEPQAAVGEPVPA